jgi:calcineurin-like phosphoesterase family protein
MGVVGGHDGAMATWFTSDLHLGHQNIIRYCGRPFADVAAMNEALIERWNQTVGPDDTVWVLGDVALGNIGESLPLVGRLKGRKLLLTGNHDRCWEGHGPRARQWVERYLEAGFDQIHQGVIELTVGDHDALACHFPYRGDSGDADRYVEERPVDDGRWLIHGHVHERWRQSERMINVGVDAWNMRPVDEATLIAMIERGRAELAPVPVAA